MEKGENGKTNERAALISIRFHLSDSQSHSITEFAVGGSALGAPDDGCESLCEQCLKGMQIKVHELHAALPDVLAIRILGAIRPDGENE